MSRQKTTEKFACRETERPVEAAKGLGLCSDSSYNYDDHIKKNNILKLYVYLQVVYQPNKASP